MVPWKMTWLMPEVKSRSSSGLICDSEVRKCSVSQVIDSLEVSGFPVMCAALEAYFRVALVLSAFMEKPRSLRKPLMPKSFW